MKKFIPLFLLLPLTLWAQTAQEVNLINGFVKKTNGLDFSYHSSIPVARECMLIRATDGNSSMEWLTASVPTDFKDTAATFVWLAGIGSSPGLASFDLFLNDQHLFTFWADGSDTWSLMSTSGAKLTFHTDMVDQHGDRFGFMRLTLPKSMLTAGKQQKIRVTGRRHSKTSWYMTFKLPLESGVSIKTLPALVNRGNLRLQLGVAGILHFGPSERAKLFIGGKKVLDTIVDYGYNYLRIHLPAVSKKTTYPYKLEVAGKVWKGHLTLLPVRQWRVNFVQHSHTDIGYTRPQTDILAEHLRFIDYALDYCDLTDDYPDEAKFRWTCEAAWAVDEYLKCRPPAQIERLKKRVHEGRIEITGMYFNFDELPDEQVLAASLKVLANLREHGFMVETAMQNDVNGIGWALNDYFTQTGIRYLNMGTHGHRALICFDLPTLFLWESPSGNRMLTFRAEHYMIGNTRFKIHGDDFDLFEDELLSYLAELEAKGYPYDLISLQHSGYITDNSPPSTHASEMIRLWNERYAWPKLRTASATDFFKTMEQNLDAVEVIRGAWPDWWTDGFGASAREVATTRYAQGDLIAAASGLAMAAASGVELPVGIKHRFDLANNALLFYTEHTVGYHGSVRQPLHRYTMEQRALKESYAWEAGRRARMVGEETMGLLQSQLEKNQTPTLVVYNTLTWKRSGLFKVYIDHQIVPRYSLPVLTDANGNQAFAQPLEHHSDGNYWAVWVDDVPPFGYKRYSIAVKPDADVSFRNQHFNKAIHELSNPWYTIRFDTISGVIISLFDRNLQKELLDPAATYPAGSFIYEQPDNREQMEAFHLSNFTRNLPDSVWFVGFERGAIWDAVRFKANSPAATTDGALVIEYRLYHVTPRVELLYDIEKRTVTTPEGIYIAIPLADEFDQHYFDVQGGEVKAGYDQIPGSANDWNTVQTYARGASGHAQVIISSTEAPLMQFGGINTGRYRAGAVPQSAHIYGWPMNNYWTTNFNADQRGGHLWAYQITTAHGNSAQDALRIGWGQKVPFLARVIPGGGSGLMLEYGSFVNGWPDNLLLISAIPEQNGGSVILQVRETNGKALSLSLQHGINGRLLDIKRVDVTGDPLNGRAQDLLPLESGFFRITF